MTPILVASRRGRFGVAASVVRMVPLEYSPVISSAPNTPPVRAAVIMPVRDSWVGSKPNVVPRAVVQRAVGHQPGHQQGGHERESERDGRRSQREDLGELGLGHVLGAVVPRAGRPGGYRSSSSLHFSVARLADTAAPDVVDGRYSTSSWVSSMNASSNDAVTGVSSWTRRPWWAARSPICGAVRPLTVNDPPSSSLPTVAPAPAERRGERRQIGGDELDAAAAAPGDEVGHAGLGDQPPTADHHQPVGGERHLADQVAGHEHRPTLRRQVPQEVADPTDALGVEAVDRLVEEQHAGVAEQGGGDAEPLAHAERELPGPAAGDGGQPDLVEDLVDPAEGDVVGEGQPPQVVAGGAAGWNAFASSRAPTSRSGQASSA